MPCEFCDELRHPLLFFVFLYSIQLEYPQILRVRYGGFRLKHVKFDSNR